MLTTSPSARFCLNRRLPRTWLKAFPPSEILTVHVRAENEEEPVVLHLVRRSGKVDGVVPLEAGQTFEMQTTAGWLLKHYIRCPQGRCRVLFLY